MLLWHCSFTRGPRGNQREHMSLPRRSTPPPAVSLLIWVSLLQCSSPGGSTTDDVFAHDFYLTFHCHRSIKVHGRCYNVGWDRLSSNKNNNVTCCRIGQSYPLNLNNQTANKWFREKWNYLVVYFAVCLQYNSNEFYRQYSDINSGTMDSDHNPFQESQA